MNRAWLIAVAVLAHVEPAAPLQQPASFRSSVDVIAVDVHVLGDDGRPVPDLRPDEFIVTVDGRPRTVHSADFVTSRTTTATPEPIRLRPQPVFSTNLAPSGPTPGRTIMIVVDEDNIRPGAGRWAAQAAAGFLDRIQPDDLVGLVTIPQGTAAIDPTTDRATLRNALERVSGHLTPETLVPPNHSLGLSEAFAYRGDQQTWRGVLARECGTASPTAPCSQELAGYAQAIMADVQPRTTRTMRAFAGLLDGLARLPGPKTVILISQELAVASPPGRDFLAEAAGMTAAASRARATVHVVHLDEAVADVEMRREPPSASADASLRSNGLETIATMTGGRRWMVAGQPAAVFDRITVEISGGYYLLGLRAEVADRDGQPHELRVAVKRPGVEVRSRRAFAFAAPATSSTAKSAGDLVRSLLESRATATTVPLVVTTYVLPAAASQRADGPGAAVLISAEIDRGQTSPVEMAVGYTLLDAMGRNAGASVETLTLQPALGHPDRPLCYLGTALVAPGEYMLRLAVADSALRAGTVVHRLSVRPLNVGGYSFSDLVILDPWRADEARPRPSARLLASGELTAYLEARAPAGAAPSLSARLEIAEGEDAAALASGEMSVQVSGERSLVHGVLAAANLPAGNYVARVVLAAGGEVLGRLVRAFRLQSGPGASAAPEPGAAGLDTAVRPESPTAGPGAMQLVRALERDLRLIDKELLTRGERKQCDEAKSLLARARRMENATVGNEPEALSLAMAASKHLEPLVRRQLKLETLLAAAGQYRSGNVVAAVQALSDSLASDLAAPVRFIEDNRDRLGVEGTSLADVDDTTLAALCLLETEIAFLGRYDAETRLEFAKRLLWVADATRLPPRFGERWYIAVAGHLQREVGLRAAMLHVEDALRRFPHDPGVLVAAGMFSELIALPGVDLGPGGRPRLRGDAFLRGGYTTSDVTPAAPPPDKEDERLAEAKRTGLVRAQQLYRQAAAADDGLAEAHLRLGRVLFLSSRADEALSELRLVAGSQDVRTRYLAALFEGAVHEGGGRLDSATRFYQEAVQACPTCLTGGLALSHAQRQNQMADLSVRTLEAAAGKAGLTDFWWDYPLGTYWQRDLLIRELRGGLR